MHLYESNWNDVQQIIGGMATRRLTSDPVFDKPTDLVDWLWEKANGTGILASVA